MTDNVDYKNSLFCYCEKKAGENVHRLKVMEIGQPAPGSQKLMKIVDMQMQEGDFPVLMQDSAKYGVVFIMTKFGFLYMYELSTASLLGKSRVTDQLCFVAAKNQQTDGMIVINKAGQIFSINV